MIDEQIKIELSWVEWKNKMCQFRCKLKIQRHPFIKIQLLLHGARDIANYGQLGTLTRLHIICIHSNLALIRYGADNQFQGSIINYTIERERERNRKYSLNLIEPANSSSLFDWYDIKYYIITKGLASLSKRRQWNLVTKGGMCGVCKWHDFDKFIAKMTIKHIHLPPLSGHLGHIFSFLFACLSSPRFIFQFRKL